MKSETVPTALARPSLVNDDEINRYEQAVKDFTSGKLDADRFMAFTASAKMASKWYVSNFLGENSTRVNS
jgi:hypothetical protein